jgi:hypothetical protein
MLPAPADHRCRSRILLTCVCEPCCWSSSSSWSRQSRSPAMATARMPWGLTERPGSGRCTYTRRDQRSPALELQAYAALRRRRRQGPADTHCQPSYAALSFDRSIDQVRNKSLVNGSLQREVSWTARLSLQSPVVVPSPVWDLPSPYSMRPQSSRRPGQYGRGLRESWLRPAGRLAEKAHGIVWFLSAQSQEFDFECLRSYVVTWLKQLLVLCRRMVRQILKVFRYGVSSPIDRGAERCVN